MSTAAAHFEPLHLETRPGVLGWCLALALVIEGLLFVSLFHLEAPAARPPIQTLEVEIVSQTTQPASAPPPQKKIPRLSPHRKPVPSTTATPDEASVKDQSTTVVAPLASGPPRPATHGPVAIYSPSPRLPERWEQQNLHTSVVLDFVVTADNHVTVQLVHSSGEQELDALALAAAEKWRFEPAEKDHQPVSARVRLRIEFEVK